MFPSILETPFFEAVHSDLAKQLNGWASTALPAIENAVSDEALMARALVKSLGDAGWLRLFYNEAKGGGAGELDVRSLCLAREIIAKHSGRADASFAMQGLGSSPILLFGSSEQRKRYLPKVIAGLWIPAFALSEAQSGSDAAAIQTSAERKGDKYVINGTKTWISNAGIADFYVVFARTGEAPGARGVSAFIVDRETKGFEVSEQFDIIAPHVIGSLRFDNCVIEQSQLLGAATEGFKVAMGVLDIYRATVGAAAIGFAKRALQESIAHCASRNLFGQNLIDFQATKMRLADMAAQIESSSLLVYRAAWTRDILKRRVTYESSLAKMVATESAQQVIDSAVQLFGGLGVRKGSVVEKLYREIRPLRIYEGATEIQKLVIMEQLLKRWAGSNSI